MVTHPTAPNARSHFVSVARFAAFPYVCGPVMESQGFNSAVTPKSAGETHGHCDSPECRRSGDRKWTDGWFLRGLISPPGVYRFIHMHVAFAKTLNLINLLIMFLRFITNKLSDCERLTYLGHLLLVLIIALQSAVSVAYVLSGNTEKVNTAHV